MTRKVRPGRVVVSAEFGGAPDWAGIELSSPGGRRTQHALEPLGEGRFAVQVDARALGIWTWRAVSSAPFQEIRDQFEVVLPRSGRRDAT